MFDRKPNDMYNDTLNAKAEFFLNKSKIMHNNAQCWRLVCWSMWRYPDIHKDYNNKHRVNILYLITDWKNKVIRVSTTALFHFDSSGEELSWFKFGGGLAWCLSGSQCTSRLNVRRTVLCTSESIGLKPSTSKLTIGENWLGVQIT